MSGSVRWYNYVADSGTTYAILCDKSNAAAVNASAAGPPGTLPVAAVPRNIKPRYALFSSADGLTKRKVVVLTPTDYAALTPSSNFTPQGTSVTVTLSYLKGEAVRLPKLADTGLTT